MGVAIFWALGEGIITYRWVKAGAPPTPGTLLMASGFYALCALLGEYPPARVTATLLAGGITLAAYLQIVGKAPAAQATGWPPLMINDPTVLLPAGVKNGQALPEGAGAGNPVA